MAISASCDALRHRTRSFLHLRVVGATELLGLRIAIFRTSMNLSILLFASYADAFGARRVDVPLVAPCTVRDVVQALRALPGGARLPTSPLVAVNQVWVGLDARVAAGDEVAVIPPVAGG